MKRKKIFAAVIVVFVLFVFTSLAYSKDPGNGIPFRRLEERIGQNEFDIMDLQSQINTLQSQINALQGPQAILVGGEGSFSYDGTGKTYYFDKAIIVPTGEEEESDDESYTFGLIIASEFIKLDAILSDPMDVEEPEGWGDALWISIYSSSETKLEPGLYSYQESRTPFTFDDLMLITDFWDVNDDDTMFYITTDGTITVTEGSDTVTLHFDAFLVEEEEEEEEGLPVSGYGTGYFTYTVPSP